MSSTDGGRFGSCLGDPKIEILQTFIMTAFDGRACSASGSTRRRVGLCLLVLGFVLVPLPGPGWLVAALGVMLLLVALVLGAVRLLGTARRR